ncbi:MAG: right-handed parallel beta-helix repeat-containing protein, partial [Bacillota bacterium]
IEDSIETLSAKSSKNETLNVIEERGSDFELQVKIKHQETGREKIYNPTISDYTDLTEQNSVKFENIATGKWDITVTVKAKLGDYAKTTIASEENVITATVSNGGTSSTTVNVVQEKGGLVLNAGDGINNLSDLKTLELKDSNGTVKTFNSDGDKWGNLNAKHYELFVELEKDSTTYSRSLSIMILPGITQDITISIDGGSNEPTISYNFPPSAPEVKTAEADNTNDEIKIEWNEIEEAKSYNIVRREPYSSRNDWEIIATGIEGSSYTDTNATSNVVYEYAVIAVNGNLTSDYSQSTDPVGLGVKYITTEDELNSALSNNNISTIFLNSNLNLTTAVDINRNVAIKGAGYSIDAGIDIINEAKVEITNLNVKNVGNKLSGLSTDGMEDIIIGIRSGTLTANNITIEQSREKDGVNLVGVSVQGGQTLNLMDSTINLTDSQTSLVYGVYAQKGAIATIDNNKFNLENTRRTLGVGIGLDSNINNNISVSGNTTENNPNGEKYMVQIYNGGNKIEEKTLHDWVETLINIDTREKAYIYNGDGFYGYPPTYNVNTAETYDTIQAAVDNANDNDTIIIRSGTYAGFNLTKGLTIKGIGDVTVEAGDVTGEPRPTGIFVQIDAEINIENITFDGSTAFSNDADSLPQGILTSSSYNPTVNINDCVFNNLYMGVYFNPDASGTIKNNEFNDNDYSAISIAGTGSVEITDNTIEDTDNSTDADIGLEIYNPNASWSGNTFTDISTEIQDNTTE